MNANQVIHMNPFSLALDLEAGTMPGAKSILVRKASDMKGYYEDEAALARIITGEGDPVHYEVFETPVPLEYGQLMYCISTLQPGKVGDEYFFTKGHYHSIPGTAEIYLCLAGEGLMLMMTPDGKQSWEKMTRGSMVYVPPYWAHRSINTGSVPLVSFCVYPAEAGHNYGDIASQGFGKRVFGKGGQVVIA